LLSSQWNCCLLPPLQLFDAFSSREPVPASLANAMRQQTVDGLQGALEIFARSSYVLETPIGVWSRQCRRCAPERGAVTRLEMPIWMK
jgi:hypothetical protein